MRPGQRRGLSFRADQGRIGGQLVTDINAGIAPQRIVDFPLFEAILTR